MQRTALVTGATAGFGTAICRTLIENGYRVIGTGRRVARLEQLQQELGENFHFLAFDISDRQQKRRSIPFPLIGNPLIYW